MERERERETNELLPFFILVTSSEHHSSEEVVKEDGGEVGLVFRG